MNDPHNTGAPVFVTDGELRSTLAVVRSLGKAGIPVTVGAVGRQSLAGSSRWAAATVQYPCPISQPSEFRSFIREHVHRNEYSLLIPMSDKTMQLLSNDKDALGCRTRTSIPGAEQVRRVQNKAYVLSVAQGIGIGIPKTHTPSSAAELRSIADSCEYPVVIKPRQSWVQREEGWSRGSVTYAHTPEELISKYWECDAQIPGPLIQERVQGEGRGVFLLICGGQLKALFCHRRVREKPPSGGVSVYSESVSADPALVEKCVELLRRIGWEGPAMVEFKVDKNTGTPKLMEINGRFWGSLELAIHAGVDFPVMLYRLAMGENIEPQLSYRVGVTNRWLVGDLQSLTLALRSADMRSLRAKLGRCIGFFPIWERNGHLEDLQFSDLSPFIFEIRELVGRMTQRFRSGNETQQKSVVVAPKNDGKWGNV